MGKIAVMIDDKKFKNIPAHYMHTYLGFTHQNHHHHNNYDDDDWIIVVVVVVIIIIIIIHDFLNVQVIWNYCYKGEGFLLIL